MPHTLPTNPSAYHGLSEKEALSQQTIYGLNQRPVTKQKTWVHRFFGIMAEPMMLLLLATAIVYFFIGDKLETIILLGSIIPIALMEFFQETKTDEAVRALDKMLVQFCSVYRDGVVKKLEIKYLVPGDLVYLTAGDKVPADGCLINSPGLMIDESMLTGESIAVIKSPLEKPENPIDENKLWQGTNVVQGEGQLFVTATGAHTTYGKLGGLLEKIIKTRTPLQLKIQRLVRGVAIAAVSIAFFVGLILTWQQGWAAGLLGGLTLAMSLIPEEFPVVFSVFLIMGVWRMTKQNALVREMAMVETLGSATIICTDKTGTLTEGSMAIKSIYYKDKLIDCTDITKHKTELINFIKTTLLSLEQVAIDPIEIEAQSFAHRLGIDTEKFYREHTLIDDLPFDAKTKMVHHLWKNINGTTTQYTAGAPEFILNQSKMNTKERALATAEYEKMAEQGLRVIGVAERPDHRGDKVIVADFKFVGLLAMSDPPRAGVKEAVATCQEAGIRVIMITGDNKLTAHSIAEAIGLKHNEEILTGADLTNLSPAAWQETVKRHDIFTRVQPEQKYQIVEALQALGEVVAMTGDGVNDAPALKKASIGIAMGQKGTEVARAAAGIVLTDDNFSTIVNAVREGRRIYENLRQAFVFLFSFHLPIVGLAILPLIFKQPLIFLPIHIIFLELICDPAAVLGFERERARHGLMNEPPRPVNEPLINPKSWWRTILQGTTILIVSAALYLHFAYQHNATELARTMAFGSLVVSQTFLILFTREWEQVKSNHLLLSISTITLLALTLIISLSPLRQVFHLTTLNWQQIGGMVLIPIATMFVIGKIVNRK